MLNIKRTTRRILALLLAAVLFAALFTTGCSGVDTKEVEKKALQYYKNKYGMTSVSVTGSYQAGNNGLFGLIGVKDMAVEMSDGYSVYWDSDTDAFADNAQADEIMKDFNEEILSPLTERFSFPHKQTDAYLNRTDCDSFDECVFTVRYEGNIRSFLNREKPKLSGLMIVLESDDVAACEKEITVFYEMLGKFVSGWSEIYVLNSGLDSLILEDWYPNINDLNVTARARLGYSEDISWYRQKYIEVFEGIYVTSAKDDFVLEDGDIVFEEAGTCKSLQQMLDDGYYALPVEAPENKNGGYHVHDQKHENHVFIKDTDAPLYRLKMSDRVKDELDEQNSIGVYVIDRREGGEPLMMYYGPESRSTYSVYSVCPNREERGEYDSLSPDHYYFFGEVTWE